MILNSRSFCDPFGNVYKNNIKITIDIKLQDHLDLVLKKNNRSTFQFEHKRVKFISCLHEWDFKTLKNYKFK